MDVRASTGLAEGLLGERDDRAAQPRAALDEPEGLEVAQRLADRRLARAELGRDPRLHEPLTGGVLAGRDALEQPVPDLAAERRARNAWGDGAPGAALAGGPPLVVRHAAILRPRRGSTPPGTA